MARENGSFFTDWLLSRIPLCSHIRMIWFYLGGCKEVLAEDELYLDKTYNTALQMTSTVPLWTKFSSLKTFPDCAYSKILSFMTRISSRKAGSRAVKFLEEKPGLNMLLHSFHSWPSRLTKSLHFVNG